MKKKQVTMLVTVSVPHWLTAAQARREVRTLIRDQCFYGHYDPVSGAAAYDDNFKVVAVTPEPYAVSSMGSAALRYPGRYRRR